MIRLKDEQQPHLSSRKEAYLSCSYSSLAHAMDRVTAAKETGITGIEIVGLVAPAALLIDQYRNYSANMGPLTWIWMAVCAYAFYYSANVVIRKITDCYRAKRWHWSNADLVGQLIRELDAYDPEALIKVAINQRPKTFRRRGQRTPSTSDGARARNPSSAAMPAVTSARTTNSYGASSA